MVALMQRAFSLAAVLAVLVQIALAGPTCTRYTMEPGFVGGGFLSDDVFLTIHNFVSGSTRETRVRYRNVNTGAIVKNDVFPLGSIHAVTCPGKSYYAISHIALAFGDGTNIVQPFIYNADGASLGYVFRTTKDRFWQMYFSPSCDTLLVRSDDMKSQTWDINNLLAGNKNNFFSRNDGNWMQLVSDTLLYTGSGKRMFQSLVDGFPGQGREKKLLNQWRLTGNVRSFAISPTGTFMFATGTNLKKTTAFKSIVRLFGTKFLVKNFDASANDLTPRYTAFNPQGTSFAGVFSQTSGALVKVYNTSGFFANLRYTMLPGTSANQIFYSPSGNRMLVFGTAANQEFWMCNNVA